MPGGSAGDPGSGAVGSHAGAGGPGAGDDRRDPGGRVVHFFDPGTRFPSFSLTGKACSFDCGHCGGRYLSHMVDVSDPADLVKRAEELKAGGGIGFLLSGGCAPDGSVVFSSHLDALRTVKDRTGLIINAHTGLTDGSAAKRLKGAGVDVVSVDVVGRAETVNDVYGFEAGPDDYRNTLTALGDAGDWKIVPHVCLGLGEGDGGGEYDALDLITEWGRADALVVISFIPTAGTRMEEHPPVTGEALARFISVAKEKLDAPVVLGCMRPKTGGREEEVMALEAGADGIVLPSRATVEHVRAAGYGIVERPGCCALIPDLF